MKSSHLKNHAGSVIVPLHLAVFVALLLSFIIKKTSAYDDTQKSAVMPTYVKDLLEH